MPPKPIAVVTLSFALALPVVATAQEKREPDVAERLEALEERLEAQSFAMQRLAKKIDEEVYRFLAKHVGR